MRRLKITALLWVCFSALSCASVPNEAVNQADVLSKARSYSDESGAYYKKAVRTYTDALAESKNPSGIYFELGKLYYTHAAYELAIPNLEKADTKEAQKLLAVCYYRDGKYTDALNLFAKLGVLDDDEYLYYYALTCEYHNLHGQAEDIYGKIKSPGLKAKAQEHIQTINASSDKAGADTLGFDIKELVSRPFSEEEFPQAGAVIVLTEEQISIKEDDTVEYVQYYLIKILNERGKKYGEVEFGYDSTYDKVTIDFARVIKPDGSVVNVGSKHIRDVSRYMNFPLYSNARAKIISMPEISSGVFIEYQVRLSRGKMVAGNNLNVEYLLQTSEPIQNARLTVSLPKGRKLNQRNLNEPFNMIHADFKPKVISKEGKDMYSWEFKDIPQLIPEPAMPPLVEVTPVMMLSTFQSWEDIYAWWWRLAKDKIEVTLAMQTKIDALVKDKKTLEEKVRAIHNFCARDIRYVAIEYGEAGHEPHRAGEIFTNKYGDCKDKAIVLVSMLNAIGVKAYPVLIGTKGLMPVQEDFPSLLFNHCIVLVSLEGRDIFVDPTAETALFGDLPVSDQERKVFVYFDDKGVLMDTPQFSFDHNKVLTSTTLVFEDDKTVRASRKVETFGIFDQGQRYRLRYTMPTLIEEGLKERIQDILPGATLDGYTIQNVEDMEKKIVLSYRFRGSDFLMKAGPLARVIPQLGDIDLGLASKETRRFPIDLDTPQMQEEVIQITLPKEYRLKYLPESIKKDTPWFTYENIYSFDQDTITFTERTINKSEKIEVKDYQAYKDIAEELSKNIRQCIILEKAPGHE